MNNNSTPNDNDRNEAAIGEGQPDSLSAFATAEIVSLPRVGASIDNGKEAAKAPAIDGERVVFMNHGPSRRASSIL